MRIAVFLKRGVLTIQNERKKMIKRNYALEIPQLFLFVLLLLSVFILIPIPNYYSIKEANIPLYRMIEIMRSIINISSLALILFLNWLIKKDKKKKSQLIH
jgi:uncharacterized membrane protein YkvI